MPAVRGRIEVVNRLGMHARAAAVFVHLAKKFNSEILVRKGGIEANGKSIMGVLQLATVQGESIEIRAEGKDCHQALDALKALIATKFGEKE